MITSTVAAFAAELPDDQLPAYVYDLTALREHTTAIRAAVPAEVECYYAVKANPAGPLLRVLSGVVDGFEAASGGELAHVTAAVPSARLAFGGPGKSDAELAAALRAGVHRVHVESTHELRRIGVLAGQLGVSANVLLRVNLPLAIGPVALAMGGQPSPFGIDPDDVGECLDIVARDERLVCHGMHAHLASGLTAPRQLDVARSIVAQARSQGFAEVNIGGGMSVDYTDPTTRFDWPEFGTGLKELADGMRLRIEPGRAVTAYCGWYVARVADVKRSRGKAFAVVGGGTHHLRTPATKGHDQPFDVLEIDTWHRPWQRPGVADEPITVAGQLCTPKDVLAREVPVRRLRVGDRIAFGMAGAYAWHISHHDFLMHPHPTFHYL